MNEKILIFSNDSINKNIFYKSKQLIDINEVDINKKVKCDKDSYSGKGSFKYFIGHKSNNGIRPLCIKFTQMNGCHKYFDTDNNYTNFWLMIKIC